MGLRAAATMAMKTSLNTQGTAYTSLAVLTSGRSSLRSTR